MRIDALLLKDEQWRNVILDEAHTIKNASAASTLAVRALANGLAIKAGDDTTGQIDPSLRQPTAPIPRRVALTGTPVENHLSELWSILHFLNPGYLGSQKEFRRDVLSWKVRHILGAKFLDWRGIVCMPLLPPAPEE